MTPRGFGSGTSPAATTAILCLVCACASAPAKPDATELDRAWNRVFEASIGGFSGSYEHDIDGSESDSASASYGLLVLEAGDPRGFGGGLRARHGKSDQELFEDLGPPAEAISAEGSLYLLYRWCPTERFRMPARIGPWVDGIKLSFDNSDEIEWITYGGQIGVSPEYEILDGRSLALTIFGDVSLSFGTTDIDADVGGNSESFDGSSRAVALEFGPRIHFGPCFASLSYRFRRFTADESDSVGGISVRGFDGTTQGAVLMLGGGF